MKSLKSYLVESEQTYKFRIKMAEKGDNEPLPTAIATVETASEPLNEPLELNGLNGSIPIENPIAEPSIESMDKSEIIRMAMSELGKRSAATRAKNKES